MKIKERLGFLIISVCLVSGCMTPYGSKVDELRHERDTGKISEAEYEEGLKQLRNTVPWGSNPQYYENVPHYQGTFSVP